MYSFSTPWKHQKTISFSDVFRGWKEGALGTIGVKETLAEAHEMFCFLFSQCLEYKYRVLLAIFSKRNHLLSSYTKFFENISDSLRPFAYDGVNDVSFYKEKVSH